jgi:hypothetical protein
MDLHPRYFKFLNNQALFIFFLNRLVILLTIAHGISSYSAWEIYAIEKNQKMEIAQSGSAYSEGNVIEKNKRGHNIYTQKAEP